MGTKNNPGSYDCYANAEPDEPMFILLARDPVAPLLVRWWAELRHDIAIEKLSEAIDCADAMNVWRREHRPEKKPPVDFNLEVARERVVAAARAWAIVNNSISQLEDAQKRAHALHDAVEEFEKACR